MRCTIASSTSVHALPGLGADGYRVGRIEANRALDHFARAFDIRTGQIDFVDDRNDLEPVVDSQIGVRKSLCFHALRGIDYQKCAFAR